MFPNLFFTLPNAALTVAGFEEPDEPLATPKLYSRGNSEDATAGYVKTFVTSSPFNTR